MHVINYFWVLVCKNVIIGLCLFCNYVHYCAYRILGFVFVPPVLSFKVLKKLMYNQLIIPIYGCGRNVH